MRLLLLVEARPQAAQLKYIKDEFDFLHKHLKIPLKFRIYWPDPEIIREMGYEVPDFVKSRGYDLRKKPGLDARVGSSRYPVPTGHLDLGLYIGKADGPVGDKHSAGWLFVFGKDQNSRRVWVAAFPPAIAKAALPRLEKGIGISLGADGAQKRSSEPQGRAVGATVPSKSQTQRKPQEKAPEARGVQRSITPFEKRYQQPEKKGLLGRLFGS